MLFGGLDENRSGGQRIDKEVTDPAEDDDEDSGYQYQIWGISTTHRLVLVVIYLMRVLVCIILTTFGTTFLLGEEDYLDLVMNSLALTFILEIDSILFALVERDVSAEMQRCKALTFQSRLPYEGMFGYALKKECWALFLVPILSFMIVTRYTYRNKVPVLMVLQCACTQTGEKCLDSMAYQGHWWDLYWGKVLPQAIHEINALRIAGT